MSSERAAVVVNPRSGGLSPAVWARLAGPIAHGLGPMDVLFTQGPGDGARLARAEAASGRRLIVACGGDGTISEVANGILGSGRAPGEVEMGIIPRGTGGDFRRTLELPADVGGAARRIREAPARRIDVGRVAFVHHDGSAAERFFLNVASFGFSSAVASKANASSKRLGGRVAYLTATVRTLLGYDNVEVDLRIDGGEPQRRTLLLGAVGNGRYFGGGMKICPEALLDDGELDLVTVGDLGRWEVLGKVGRLYDGSHLALDSVKSARVRKMAAAPVDPRHEIPIELDGETPGRLPATFEIAPGTLALRF